LKFKILFLFFNCMLILFLLILFFMPFLILGKDLAPAWNGNFIRSLWPLGAILTATLIILDFYYFSNRKLFRLLEREDWPALAGHLETRLPRRGRYPAYLVRLYANTCLVLSDFETVLNLENKLALVKPAMVERNALLFGTARILGKDYAGALRFFAARDRALGPGPVRGFGAAVFKGRAFLSGFFAGDRTKRSQWLAWFHGFALILNRRFEEAAEKFRLIAEEAADPLVAALAAWFLTDSLSPIAADSQEAALAARERVRSSLTRRKDWEREIAKNETEIYAAILRKYINKAGDWIYNP
jgi:hypothetical protein